MIGRLALAGSDPHWLAEAAAMCPAGRRLDAGGGHDTITAAAHAALTAALGALAPEHRAAVPLVLAVSGPCVAAASHFTLRSVDGGRRLRPSESVQLETAEIVRTFGLATRWRGPCYLLATPGLDGVQAVRAAAALSRRHPAVLVGELLTGPDGTVAGVVATWEPAPPHRYQPPPPDRPLWSALLALASAGRVGVPV